MSDDERGECWWIVLRDGTPVRGDRDGGVSLLREIRRTRPIGRFLGALHLSAVIDAFDKVVARYRKHLGRFVPDGPAPRRFP